MESEPCSAVQPRLQGQASGSPMWAADPPTPGPEPIPTVLCCLQMSTEQAVPVVLALSPLCLDVSSGLHSHVPPGHCCQFLPPSSLQICLLRDTLF